MQRGGGPGAEADGAQERARHRVQDLFGSNNLFLRRGFQMSSFFLSHFCVHKALCRERLSLVKEEIYCSLIFPCCRCIPIRDNFCMSISPVAVLSKNAPVGLNYHDLII